MARKVSIKVARGNWLTKDGGKIAIVCTEKQAAERLGELSHTLSTLGFYVLATENGPGSREKFRQGDETAALGSVFLWIS